MKMAIKMATKTKTMMMRFQQQAPNIPLMTMFELQIKLQQDQDTYVSIIMVMMAATAISTTTTISYVFLNALEIESLPFFHVGRSVFNIQYSVFSIQCIFNANISTADAVEKKFMLIDFLELKKRLWVQFCIFRKLLFFVSAC